MPVATLNGIALTYDDTGEGDPVLLVTGTGATRRAWHLHQVPGLTRAGHRVVTFDNRGIAPNEDPPGGITLDAMAGDAAALIEHLDLAPCRVVGFSMGASVVAELLLARPELVHSAVLMAGRARLDAFGAALLAAEREMYDSGCEPPATHRAVHAALSYLSPRTRRDDQAVRDWLEVFAFAPPVVGAGVRAQLDLDDHGDRRERYAAVTTPVLSIGFADDVLCPPHLAAEIAESIPGAAHREIADCGHYGHLERPEQVNAALLEFFGAARTSDPKERAA
ncbi:alpha/beta hydrolase [Streptomyces sp. XM4193]|uniref:alpha/beta fold hydrolase n=1 Tax=Streptomyces sp. XM4193 TaxID=2929782 RepID=UPI001FFC2706|nr:alpha/beta hydrolase [Streptomyces sp. XM4193]MCK1798053.1 alpha/beta hydrolase [Streptomyces sp. XM4193]